MANEENFDKEVKEMLSTLKNISTLDMQISQFIYCVTPDISKMVPIYHKVNSDMAKSLNIAFRQCEVFPFGSTTTSLQFKYSDIDLFAKIKNKESDALCLREAKKALHRSGLFRNILGIPSAKIPIIKCVHSGTGVKCDVNFKSICGVMNSKLISYYLSIDPKLRPVMLVIKYWAKIHDISGRNHLFTNYSLIMMFIFYLQQHYDFPSVRSLQNDTKPTEPDVIWNMNIFQSYNEDYVEIASDSQLSILEGFSHFILIFPTKQMLYVLILENQ
ncbi:hypothetical protein HHI36_010686 [Cryptolaemus montrouzieri]|uniref:Poly(A) RNA polymerase mitochondrial-like central palm domain-containing protein n=1 Tax=Cryptolaemus montrouzieri TaxID=559131 RepID=A0ABD2MK71_9CUCU